MHQTTLALAAIFAVGAFAPQACAQGGVPLWTNRYNGPGYSADIGKAITVDRSGNVFVTGESDGGSNYDFVTIKYSNAGLPLWTNRYDGPENGPDLAAAMAMDSSGNVFVTGSSFDASAGAYDYVTLAYSNAGVPLWTNRYHGPGNGNDYVTAIAVDSSGNVFVTGYSTNRSSGYDYATVAYSGTGMPLWTNRYNGPGNGDDKALAIGVDSSGNVFVTGSSYGSDMYSHYATIKYSSGGVPLWTNRYSGPANRDDGANALAVDSSGNVFVTGYSTGTNGATDYATVAYSGAGGPLWTSRYHGPANRDDVAYALAVDSNGKVFVTGSSFGIGTFGDYVTLAYSAMGVALWTNRYNGPAGFATLPTALALDTSGNVFVTGYSGGSGFDYATVAYSSAGLPLWTNRYSGPGIGDDVAYALAVDSNGNVFVTGTALAFDYLTIKYSSSLATAAIQVSPLASLPGVPDFIVIAANNATAYVTLHGSSSSAPDNGPLTYQWFNDADSRPFASGVMAADCLGVGTHSIHLVVTDSHGATGSATVTVEIISPCTAVGIAMGYLGNSHLSHNRKHPLLVSLETAGASFEGGHLKTGINQLRAFEHKVRAQVARHNPTLAQQLIEAVQAIIGALHDAP